MSHCGHEHHGDGHHDHSHAEEEALKESLYSKIQLDRVRALNESEPGAGKSVFKPYHMRMHRENFLDSDADETLIIFVPFTGLVKLKSVSIWGGPGGASPSRLKAFINREDVDFDTVESMECTQEWELARDAPEPVEYNTRITKFGSVRNLTLYIPENYGEDVTRVYYIGLKGEWTEIPPDPIITEYEVFANPSKFRNVKTDVGPAHYNPSG